MILRYKYICNILFLICLPLISIGQTPKDHVQVAVKPVGSDLIVRWAPTTDKVWLRMKKGYALVSYQCWSKGEKYNQRTEWQFSDTIRVWTKDKFNAIVNTPKENPYLMLAGYLMHEPYETLKTPGQDLASLVDRKDELSNRFSSGLFVADMDSLAAEAQAMRYVIKDFDPQKYYVVAVHLFADDLILNNIAEYSPDETYEITPNIDKYEEQDQKIILSWNKEKHAKYFTAYWIERSADGKSFEKLTESPYLHAFDIQQESTDDDYVYIDSVSNYKPYYYRITGIDPFGYTSQPGKPLRLSARDRTPPLISYNQKAEVINSRMQISWSHDADPDLDHFSIAYSQTYAGTYFTLKENINKNERTYEHTNFEGLISNYYKVCAIDTAGNKACTTPFYGFFNDTIPPAKPRDLIGIVDSLGHVKLTWPLGTEKDLYGYNIYFCNRYNGVFSILNEGVIQDTVFMDTINLNSLTSDIFYRITAVDIRDNISTFSDMARIIRPDTIPPGAAVFIDYKSTENGIALKWANPSTSDLDKIVLWRQAQGAEYLLLKTFSPDTNTYFDQNILPNKKYSYRLISYDNSGLNTKSPHDLLVTSNIKSKFPTVALDAVQVGNKVEINIISGLKKDEFNKLIIYKSKLEKPFITWKTIHDPQDLIHQDEDVKPGEKYQYKAYYTNKAGIKSSFTEVTSVEIKSE